jgi:hypothetical protein
MQCTTIKKQEAGVWNPIHWRDLKPNDNIRIYERGTLSDLGLVVLEASHKFEDSYWEVLTDKGLRNSKGLFSLRSVLRNPSKKKHRARAKKATPGG